MTALPKDYIEFSNTTAFNDQEASLANDQAELAQENRQLQRQLRALLANVRQNEEKLKRFQELELRLIACTEIFELLQIVIYEYRATSHLDRVSLVLYDPEYELQRLLEDEGIRVSEHPDIIFTDNISNIDAFYGFSLKPYLGQYEDQQHRQFFPTSLQSSTSVALIPLSRNMELVGSLNLASHQSGRFMQNNGTDFLQRLASIVTVCLKNVANQERLKKLGLTDVLTGVNNRRFFDQRLNEEVGRAQRDGLTISCLFFDVDHFKKVNDTYGHNEGDMVLREVASLIRMNLRTSDVIARYGGEEFSAILNNTDAGTACEIAERIRIGIENREFTLSNGDFIRITTSIGIATIQAGKYNLDIHKLGNTLLQKADQCLYEAKRSGRNKIICTTDQAISDKSKQLDMFGN